MEKLVANSKKVGQGIIDEIERKSKELPVSLNLERFKETKKNAYRVKSAKLSWEFDKKVKSEEVDEYLKRIPTKKD